MIDCTANVTTLQLVICAVVVYFLNHHFNSMNLLPHEVISFSKNSFCPPPTVVFRITGTWRRIWWPGCPQTIQQQSSQRQLRKLEVCVILEYPIFTRIDLRKQFRSVWFWLAFVCDCRMCPVPQLREERKEPRGTWRNRTESESGRETETGTGTGTGTGTETERGTMGGTEGSRGETK